MKRLMTLALAATFLVAVSGCSAQEASPLDATTNQDAASVTPAAKAAPAKLVIPAGTPLRVILSSAVGSDISSAGDNFTASLAEALVIDGKTVLAAGTKFSGNVVSAQDSGRVKGLASIELALTGFQRNSGATTAIMTEPFGATAEPTKARDAGIIAGGSGVGAAIGAIAGGKKGAAIGAIAGGGAGTGAVLATKGNSVQYGSETLLNFTLAKSVSL